MIKGVDVSRSRGTIDWDKVKANNIKFAILKFGNIYDDDSNYIDTKFETNYKKCKELDIPVGIYVYNYCNGLSALKKGVEFVLKKLNKKELDLPIYLDMEDKTIKVEGKKALTEQCVEFCNLVEKAGYKAGVYANLTWFKNYIDASKLNCSIWVAQYNNKCTYTGKYDIWQYSSTEKVKGISGNVDVNYLYNEDLLKKETKPKTENTKPKAEKPILEWQKVMNKVYKCGLAEDNSFGPDSKAKANKYYLYYSLFKKTIVNDHVKFIQNRLITKGYSCGKKGADGSFGPDTKKAVKAFQKANGLKQDGQVGADTTAKLLK